MDSANIKRDLAEQMAAEVILNPKSHKDVNGFREALSEALLASVSTLDRESAMQIANQVPITDALRMDILQQAIIYAGVKNGYF